MRQSYRVAIQTAFIAVASRMVGSCFRVGEAYSPSLKKAGVVMDPKTVIQREAITMGLAWGFAFLTTVCVTPLTKRYRWNKDTVTFITALLGSAFAETLSRLVAYRNISKPGPSKMIVRPVIPPAPKVIRIPSAVTSTPVLARGLRPLIPYNLPAYPVQMPPVFNMRPYR